MKANFKITKQSLGRLKAESVPDDILEKLKSLKDQEVTGEEEFLEKLKTTIGEEQTVKFKFLILKHAASDEELMLRVKYHDDEAAYQELSSRCRGGTKGFFISRYPAVLRKDVDDLIQKVWIKVWAGRHTFKAGCEFRPWLNAIERSTFIDWVGRASFGITEQSLESLKAECVPDEILKKLESLKDQKITRKKEFLDILKKTIGDEQTVKFKSLILKHARLWPQVPITIMPSVGPIPDEQVDKIAFKRAWNLLDTEQQKILYKIYWEGRTQKEVAAELGISLPTLRSRKRKAEEKLAQYLTEEGILVEPIKPEKEGETEGNEKEDSQKPDKEVDDL